MALDIRTVIKGNVAEITLSGELTAATRDQFLEELKAVAAYRPSDLVLRVRELKFLGSPGVRVLLLIKQQLMPQATIYVIAPQPGPRTVLVETVIHRSVTIQDEYPAVV